MIPPTCCPQRRSPCFPHSPLRRSEFSADDGILYHKLNPRNMPRLSPACPSFRLPYTVYHFFDFGRSTARGRGVCEVKIGSSNLRPRDGGGGGRRLHGRRKPFAGLTCLTWICPRTEKVALVGSLSFITTPPRISLEPLIKLIEVGVACR